MKKYISIKCPLCVSKRITLLNNDGELVSYQCDKCGNEFYMASDIYTGLTKKECNQIYKQKKVV